MDLFKALLIFSLVTVAKTLGGNVSLSNSTTQWTKNLSEAVNCSAVKVVLSANVSYDFKLKKHEKTRVWVEAVTEWVAFKGSYSGSYTSKATKRNQTDDKDKDAVSKCFHYCKFGNFFFSKTTCFCDEENSYISIDKPCFTNNYPFGSRGKASNCDSIKGEKCYCVTKFEPLTTKQPQINDYNQNEFGCAAVIFKNAHDPEIVAEECSKPHRFLYRNSSGEKKLRISTEELSWRDSLTWTINNKCQFIDFDFEFLKEQNLTNLTKYWIGVFRKPMRHTISKECLSLETDDSGKFRTSKNKCSDTLPVLCHQHINGKTTPTIEVTSGKVFREVMSPRTTSISDNPITNDSTNRFYLTESTTVKITDNSSKHYPMGNHTEMTDVPNSENKTIPGYMYDICVAAALAIFIVPIAVCLVVRKRNQRKRKDGVLGQSVGSYTHSDTNNVGSFHVAGRNNINTDSHDHIPCNNGQDHYGRLEIMDNKARPSANVSNYDTMASIRVNTEGAYGDTVKQGGINSHDNYGHLGILSNKAKPTANVTDYDTMASIRADAEGAYVDTVKQGGINSQDNYGHLSILSNKAKPTANVSDYDTMASIRADTEGAYGDTLKQGGINSQDNYGHLGILSNKAKPTANVSDYDTMASIRADTEGAYGDTGVPGGINSMTSSDYDFISNN